VGVWGILLHLKEKGERERGEHSDGNSEQDPPVLGFPVCEGMDKSCMNPEFTF
jgi:hypothetical protein